MSDDLVKRWDEYVESMGCVMGEVEHMAQQMRDRIEAQAAEIEWYRDRVVWGFYEDETPKFYQGKEGEHEICEPVSAKEVTCYVNEIEMLEAKLEKLIGGVETVLEAWDRGDEASFREAIEEMRADVEEAKGGNDDKCQD